MWRNVRAMGAALAMAMLSASGCGGGGDPAAGAQACHDLADTLAKGAEACGLDYQANYDAMVQRFAGGSCANIKGLRDHDSFYNQCLPFLAGLTCDQLNSTTVTFPASCNGQLQR